MADRFEFKLDKKAVGDWMRAETPGLVAKATAEVAANVRSALSAHPPTTGTPEVLTMQGINSSGRPYGLVTIAHPYGLTMQAKHGVLTRAAAEAGIQVRRY